jgi:hypothetical protein
MPSTTAASLAALRLPDDIGTLASLPPSAEAIFQAATLSETFDAVDAVYGLWLAFIELPPDATVAGSRVADSAGITLLDDLLWARVLLRLGTYCATGLHRLLSDGLPRGKTLPPGISLPPMDDFIDSGIREDAPRYQQWAKIATASYFHAVKSFYFLQTLSAVPLPQVVAVFEGVAHSALVRLVELSVGAPLGDEELLGRELTVRATRFASRRLRGALGDHA